jgi:tRNA G10  N-methylase Trm11
MHKYFFILGRSPKLARAEIEAILPTLPGEYKIAESKDDVLFLDFKIFGENGFHIKDLMKKLGGTIKVGKIIDEVANGSQVFNTLSTERLLNKYFPQKEEKITFGFSLYKAGDSFSRSFQKDLVKKGIQIKIGLKKEGLKARFVTSKDKNLSSVIVRENKLIERGADISLFFTRDKILIGKTIAVQDYKSFSKFDYGRPRADAKSGMLPPKVARTMINLAQTKPDEILLDPFCGSGTILQEALLLGINKVIGSDISHKAIEDTKQNLEWLKTEADIEGSNYELLHYDIRKLSKNLKTKVDVIVTEPFLGPPLRGNESIQQLQQNVRELSKLYLESFQTFKNILGDDGRIVIVIPVFKKDDNEFPIPIIDDIKKIGFKLKTGPESTDRGGYIYSRPDQKVLREIFVFK